MKDDALITRIRETRHGISERYGHDPRKIIEHYRELQKKYEGRLVIDEPEPTRAGVTTNPASRRLKVSESAV